MIKVGVSGASGRMGRRLISLLAEQSDCGLACALERPGHPDLGKDAGLVAGMCELGVPITEQVCGEPDVLLDFSAPEASVDHATECAALGTAVVLGTTGFSPEQMQKLERDVGARIPLLIAPNMSVGINLLIELVGQVARALGEQYDVEIVETHHRRKKDAPSGTALQLARTICEALDWDPEQVLNYGRQGVVGERPRRQLAVHAVRGGDVTGDHTIIFAGEGERIELTHRASSRDVFAQGAIRAARFLVGRPPGLYGMRDVLF